MGLMGVSVLCLHYSYHQYIHAIILESPGLVYKAFFYQCQMINLDALHGALQLSDGRAAAKPYLETL